MALDLPSDCKLGKNVEKPLRQSKVWAKHPQNSSRLDYTSPGERQQAPAK